MRLLIYVCLYQQETGLYLHLSSHDPTITGNVPLVVGPLEAKEGRQH